MNGNSRNFRISGSITLPMLASALFLHACGTPVVADGKPPIYGGQSANPPADAEPYGIDGKLDATQVDILLNLSFPQSYDAIKDRLGFPAYRDAIADYYQLPDGRWIKITYLDDKAQSFQFGDY